MQAFKQNCPPKESKNIESENGIFQNWWICARIQEIFV